MKKLIIALALLLFTFPLHASVVEVPGDWQFDDEHTDLTQGKLAFINPSQDLGVEIVNYTAKLDLSTESLAKLIAKQMSCKEELTQTSLGLSFECRPDEYIAVAKSENGYDILSLRCTKDKCALVEDFVLWLRNNFPYE